MAVCPVKRLAAKVYHSGLLPAILYGSDICELAPAALRSIRHHASIARGIHVVGATPDHVWAF